MKDASMRIYLPANTFSLAYLLLEGELIDVWPNSF